MGSTRTWRWAVAAATCLGSISIPLIAGVEPAAAAGPPASFTGPYEVVNRSTSGGFSGGASRFPTLDGDGSVVAFTSDGSNLVPGDTNGVRDVFVRDRTTGTTEIVSVSTAGVLGDDGPGPYEDEAPVLSDDGLIVAFTSRATNLVASDTNGASDVFVRDRAAGTTTRISRTAAGAQADDRSFQPSISADGRYVAFVSEAGLVTSDTDGRPDIYRFDRTTAALALVSADSATSDAYVPMISATGRWIVHTQGYRLLRRDLDTGDVVDVVRAVDGGEPNQDTYAGGVSPDGRHVVFRSYATNLTVGDPAGADGYLADLSAGTTTRLTEAVPGSGVVVATDMSTDGTAITVHQINRDLKIWWVGTPDVTVVDLDWIQDPTLSGDASALTFASFDSAIVGGDSSMTNDVFAADLVAPPDTTAPMVACEPADGAWHAADVQVPCTASDASGLEDPADAAFELSTSVADGEEEPSATTGSREVCDLEGNCTTASSTGHRVDRRAPTAVVDPSLTGTFVQGAEVPAAYGCDDAGSGVASCAGSVAGVAVDDGDPLPTGALGTSTLTVASADAVGNTSSAEADYEVVGDAVRGVVLAADGSPAGAAWVELWPVGDDAARVAVHTAPDGSYAFASGAAGVGDVQIRVADDEAPTTWFGGSSRAAATVVAVGVRPVVADVELPPVLDEVAPEVDCAAPAAGTLSDVPVTVSCTATDDVALVDPADASFELTTTVADGSEDDQAMTQVRSVCDLAGNCTDAGPFGPYLVDRAAPRVTVTSPAEGEVIPAGTLITASFSCDDLLLASCTSDVGGYLDTKPGPHSFTVTGTDVLGRTTTVVRSYRVPSTTIQGRIIENPTEVNLSGVLVELWRASTEGSGPPLAFTTTGADGRWSIGGLDPTVPYLARYSKAGFTTAWHGGSSTGWNSWPLSGPDGGTSPIYGGWLIRRDSAPPTFQCSAVPTNWMPDQGFVQCTASDPSGLSPTSPADFVLSTWVPAGTETANASTDSVPLCDVRGNCTTAGPYTGFRIDRKAPSWGCSNPPTGWQRTEVVLSCTAGDAGVGLLGAPSFSLLTAVGANNWSANASTSSRQLCDAFGNCTTATVSGIKVDRTLPTASCTPPSTTAWVSSNRAVTCTPTDTGSGYGGAPSVTASTQIALGQESATAPTIANLCDQAGNCTAFQGPTYKVDRKAPVAVCTAPDGLWHKGNVSVSCTQSDGGSGLAPTYSIPPFNFPVTNSPTFSMSTNVSSGVETANGSATAISRCDNVNNCYTPSISGHKIDNKAPTASCPTAPTTWRSTNITVTCSASDQGAGVDTSSFTVATSVADGAETASATLSTSSVCDRVNNCGALGGTGGYRIDRKAPTATCPAPAAGTIAAAEVVVACTASDGGSGLGSSSDGSFTLTTALGGGAEGTASTASRTVCDALGTCATAGPFGPYRVDRLDPRVTVGFPADGAKLPFGIPQVADHECTDLYLVSCTATTPDGEALDGSLGTHEQQVVAVDEAGRTTTVVRSYTVVADDHAAPSVSCNAPAPSTSWGKAEVVVTCASSDPVALADPGQASFTLATSVGEGATSATATTPTASVCDAFGNCRTVGGFGPYRVDRKAPVTGCAAGPTGWTKSEVFVFCFPSDEGSGLSSSAAFQLGTSIGAGNWSAEASTNHVSVCDRAGNCSLARVAGLKIDRAGPTFACETAPTTWSKVNTSVPCTPSDAGAGYTGAATVPATTQVGSNTESGAAVGTARACDVLGNCSSATVSGFKVDRRAPVVECDAPSGQWHASNRPVACRQVDGGSGIAPTSPSGPNRNLTAWTTITSGNETANAVATAGASCDLVGNCASVASHGHKIDRRAPRASCPSSDGEWRADNVSFTCTPIDEGVGVDAGPFTSATSTPPRYEPHSVPATKQYVCDRLNNCASIGSQGSWRIDRLSPRITLTGTKDGAIVRLGQPVTVGYSCKDGGSGLVSCEGSVPSDLVVTTTDLGPDSVTIESVDAVGNTTTTTVSWTVVPAVSGKIVDRTTGVPIAGATVHRYAETGAGPALESVVTAADGTFAFATLEPGRYRYSAVLPGAYPERWYGSLNLATAPSYVTDATTPRSLGVLQLLAAP